MTIRNLVSRKKAKKLLFSIQLKVFLDEPNTMTLLSANSVIRIQLQAL